MKKSYLTLFIIITGFITSSSQTLLPVGAGIPSSYGMYCGTVVFNNEIYAAEPSKIFKWDGTSWVNIGISVDYAIICMQVYNSELYVAGWFTTFNGSSVNRIVKYDGLTWQPVGTGVLVNGGDVGGVEKMTVYNGELILLGGFIQAGSLLANKIARWDGSNFNLLGNGFPGAQVASTPSMLVYNSDLYVFSQLDTAGTIPVSNAAKWDGANWSGVGAGLNQWPIASTVHDSSIYVGVNTSDTTSMVKKWTGSNWVNVGTSSFDFSWNLVADLKSYNGCLYATGYFDTIGAVAAKNIARFDGVNWNAVDNGVDGMGQFFVEYDSALYMTGDFITAGTLTMNNVVVLDSPPTCIPLSIDEDLKLNSFVVFPNPTNGLLQIKTEREIISLEVLDVFGRRIFYSENNQTEINISDFENGIYFVRLSDSKKNSITKKIIKN